MTYDPNVNHVDITIRQGTTHRETLELLLNDGSPIDLSGCELYMQIRRNFKSTDVVLDLREENLISAPDPMNGKIFINIPYTITAELPHRSEHYYDLKIKFGDGTVETLLAGKVFVIPRVTVVPETVVPVEV